MASITQYKYGYMIQFYYKGRRYTARKRTRNDCLDWAAIKRASLIQDNVDISTGYTIKDLLTRYMHEVSSKKLGYRQEKVKLTQLISIFGQLRIEDLTRDILLKWQDKRLEKVKTSTLNKDLNLLSHAYKTAINQWDWEVDNPVSKLTRLPDPPPRDRIISQKEIDLMLEALNYSPEAYLGEVSQRLGAMFIFALETAMRAKEICNLIWGDVSLHKRVVVIRGAKTRAGIREVPLTNRAVEVLAQIHIVTSKLDTVFEVNIRSRDALFRKARDRSNLEGFTFHDSRATAITQLAKKLTPPELARMVGHKNLNMLMVYFRESAENIAKILD